MHQIAPYLLAGFGGASVPTIGVAVLVGKNSNLFQEKTALEDQNRSLESANGTLSNKVYRPKVDDLVNVVENHYFSKTSPEGYSKHEEMNSNNKLQSDSKCLYKVKEVGSGRTQQKYYFHICLRITNP